MKGYVFEKAGPERIFNAAKIAEATRMVDLSPAFGIACYSGHVEGGEWVAQHVGVTSNAEQAQLWLDGADVLPQRIYANESEAS